MDQLVQIALLLWDLIGTVLGWLFSSSSAGILTIITGIIALYVYKSQIKSTEKSAAIVLLNEIRHAEKTLQLTQGTRFDVQNEIISILPNCSWDKNYHIFIGHLDRDEFELLNNFFNQAKAAQSELVQWRAYYTEACIEKAKEIQRALIRFAETENSFSEENWKNYENRKNTFLTIANKEEYLFTFAKPREYLGYYLSNISAISKTTIMFKLKKLSGER